MKETTIRSRLNPRLEVSVIAGHFATRHSHNNHYIDITRMKHEHTMAREAAMTLAQRYAYEKGGHHRLPGRERGVGCVSGPPPGEEYPFAVNSDKNINVITPEYDSNGQLLFRDNLVPMVTDRNVLIPHFHGQLGQEHPPCSGVRAVLRRKGAGDRCGVQHLGGDGGVPIYSLFTPEDIPGYATYSPENCAMCRAGERINALANSYGLSAL